MIEFTKMQKMARYSRPVIVTEKIDGTNGQITITPEGDLLVGSRTRWITPKDDNMGFARWVHEHRDQLIQLGPGTHFGEWWGNGIQRAYGLKRGDKRFSLFNVLRWTRSRPACCGVVPILWMGRMDDLDAEGLICDLKYFGSAAVPGYMKPEGIVIYHLQGNFGLKKTIDKDSTGKWDV